MARGRNRSKAKCAPDGGYTGRTAARLARRVLRLRADNQFLREAFVRASQAVALTDGDGRIIHANRGFTRIFGYTLEQAQGRLLSELVVPPEAEGQFRSLLELAGQGETAGAETVSRRKDGSQFPAAIGAVPFGARRKPAIRVTWADLTATKAAERAGATVEGQWRAIFDNSAVGIAVTDPDGRFKAANLAYQLMVGYSETELRRLTYMDLTFEDDREANAALVQELERGPFQMEKRYRRKDGNLIWVRITVSRSMFGAPATRLDMAIVEDITEKRRAEDRLREYQKVVESAREMIVVVDRDYRLVVANQAFLDYRGLRREQAIGDRIDDVSGADPVDRVIKARLDECFQGRAVEFEVKCPRSVLGERDLFISLFPIEGADGVKRAVAFIQDVTGQKRSQEGLERSFQQLRALTAQLQSVREDERTRLARELHDELGQALTAIKIDLGALQAAAGGAGTLQAIGQGISVVMNSVDRTIESVRRLSTDLRPGILDDLGLVAAVEWVAEDFERRTGIRCQVNVEEDAAPIDSGCATALFRIVQETLTNIARHAGATRVKIHLAMTNGILSLSVQDNGSGISETSLSGAGSLGLLGMRERARLLGGELEITRAPEGGTTVRVRIPHAGSKVEGDAS